LASPVFVGPADNRPRRIAATPNGLQPVKSRKIRGRRPMGTRRRRAGVDFRLPRFAAKVETSLLDTSANGKNSRRSFGDVAPRSREWPAVASRREIDPEANPPQNAFTVATVANLRGDFPADRRKRNAIPRS
jgi:hypothetical protein